MEWELRIILGIIGAAIIGYVAFDGWRRSQKAKQARQEIKDLVNVDQDARDRQGFDYLGVSEPRTIKQSSSNEQDSDNSASEIDNASVRPSASNANADQSSDKLSANKAEQIVITEDDAITADRHTMSSDGEEHLTAEPLVKSSDKSSSKYTDTVTHQEPELIFSLTLLTAVLTPLPKYLDESLSLNSMASCLPVDAPEGTEALPKVPFRRDTSTSMVGFPLLSIISRALIRLIVPVIFFPV